MECCTPFPERSYAKCYPSHRFFSPQTDLVLFAEEQVIGQCPFNSSWIRQIDSTCVTQLSECTVLCSGSILGSKKGMSRFLDLFIDEDNRQDHKAYDQGILNYLYYTGKLASLTTTVLTNDDNYVNTLGYGYKEVKEGRIVNRAGQVSTICHQYDRMTPEQLRQVFIDACTST
jgi:hypothetical protein